MSMISLWNWTCKAGQLPVILVFFRVDLDTAHERVSVCDVYMYRKITVMNLRKCNISGLPLNCGDGSDMFTNWIDQERRLIYMDMFNYSRNHFDNQEQVLYFVKRLCYSNSQYRRTASTKIKSDDKCSAIYYSYWFNVLF